MHPTSHLERHEERSYAHLHGLHATLVGPADRPMEARDLDAVVEPLACLLTELPIRESGGQLPSWETPDALNARADERGIPLHLDGAIARMPAYVAHAKAIGTALATVPGLTVWPTPPHTNLFHAFANGDAADAATAREAVADRLGIRAFGGPRPGPLPNTWQVERPIGDAALEASPESGFTCESTYGDPEDYSRSFIFGGSGECVQTVMLVPEPGCTPAVGVPMSFIYETVYDLDGGVTQHATLTPIQQSGTRYSERAWLRKVTVNNWGDTNNLHVRKFGEAFKVSGADVIDDTTSLEITPCSGVVTLPVGEMTMDTVWSVDGLPSNDPTFTLPTVTVDWSCQVDGQNPHFTSINAPQAYEVQLSELGISGLTATQRIFLRFPTTDVAYLHIEGRSSARLDFPLTALGGGVFGFDRTLTPHGGVHLAGTMTASGANRVVTFTDLEINGNDFGTPTWTFEPLP